jgi:rare lipoprotein A
MACSVVVRINDRGPFHPGRILDLSYAAAHRLGFAGKGSAEVALESDTHRWQRSRLCLPPGHHGPRAARPRYSRSRPQADLNAATRIERTSRRADRSTGDAGDLWLQLGAFSRRENAEALRQSVTAKLPELTPGLTGGRDRRQMATARRAAV